MFLNALMLAGIGGAVVPLVLHLLSRARYRSLDWGAMMFLEDMEARQQQSARLKQWILLAVRMAMLAALAVALAMPIVFGRWGGLAQEGNLTAVILLDVSASMGYEDNGSSRIDRAREAVLRILSTFRKGDRVALVMLGQPEEHLPVPTSDLQAVAARIADLKPASGSANIAHGLARARQILDRYEELNREVYLVCDRQSINWRDATESFASTWRPDASPDSAPLRFFVIPVGGTDATNVAVESVELVNPPIIRDEPAEVEIRVRNFGETTLTAVPLRLSAASRELGNLVINVPAGATASVRHPVRMKDLGSQVITAKITAPGLEMDDRCDTVVDVIEPIRVLIISGDQREGAFRSEEDFLTVALSPYAFLKRAGADIATVETLAASSMPGVDFDRYQVVVLANVPQIATEQVRAIEQYVYGGGGLLIAPGSLSRIDNYNAMFHRAGSGILPAMLESATAGDGSAETSLLGIDLSHPIFRFVRGRPDPLPDAIIARFFPAIPRSGNAQVLGSYASGQPFLIESNWGRGRVILMTTPLDADWSTLPLSSFYLPVMQSMIRHLAGGAIADRNLVSGQPLVAVFDEPVGSRVAVQLPDGHHEVIEVSRLSQRSEVRFINTEPPGLYRLRAQQGGKWKTIHFLVQPPREESDLASLTEEGWSELQSRLGFERLDTEGAALASRISAARAGRELWASLLLCVLGLAFVEMFLARHWSQEAR